MYHDDLHQAAELAHAAVASMTRFSIPPTPINFTIWYEYHAGRDPALSRAVRSPVTSSGRRSEEHTSELQSLMRISYAVFCLKKKTTTINRTRDKQKTQRK